MKKRWGEIANIGVLAVTLVSSVITVITTVYVQGKQIDILEERTKNLPRDMQQVQDDIKAAIELQKDVKDILAKQAALEAKINAQTESRRTH